MRSRPSHVGAEVCSTPAAVLSPPRPTRDLRLLLLLPFTGPPRSVLHSGADRRGRRFRPWNGYWISRRMRDGRGRGSGSFGMEKCDAKGAKPPAGKIFAVTERARGGKGWKIMKTSSQANAPADFLRKRHRKTRRINRFMPPEFGEHVNRTPNSRSKRQWLV